jgi:protein-disulfide isomerase
VVSTVTRELSGVPQAGNRLGQPAAPVTMQYFGDLECPVCQAFTLSAFDQVVAHPVRAGTLQVDYRSFQTATPNTTTFITQQVAALAAGRQDLMWDYVELFYREQGPEGTGYVTDAFLRGIASQVPGLDVARWQRDRQDPGLRREVLADETAAQRDGVGGTPTLIITGPRGKRVLSGDPPYSSVAQAIAAVAR